MVILAAKGRSTAMCNAAHNRSLRGSVYLLLEIMNTAVWAEGAWTAHRRGLQRRLTNIRRQLSRVGESLDVIGPGLFFISDRPGLFSLATCRCRWPTTG